MHKEREHKKDSKRSAKEKRDAQHDGSVIPIPDWTTDDASGDSGSTGVVDIEAVKQFFDARKDGDVDGIMGVISGAAKVLTHIVYPDKSPNENHYFTGEDSLTDFFGNTDSPVTKDNHYDIHIDKGRVVAESKTKDGNKWIPTITTFEFGPDNKISKVDQAQRVDRAIDPDAPKDYGASERY